VLVLEWNWRFQHLAKISTPVNLYLFCQCIQGTFQGTSTDHRKLTAVKVITITTLPLDTKYNHQALTFYEQAFRLLVALDNIPLMVRLQSNATQTGENTFLLITRKPSPHRKTDFMPFSTPP